MSGPENLRGVDYQVSVSLWRILVELGLQHGALTAIQFESLSDLEEDLNLSFSDGTQEYVQIKKRAEGYQWTPSDLRSVLRRFCEKNQPNRRFTFITNAPANLDVRDLRNCVKEGRISDEILEKFTGEGVSGVRLRELLGRLDLQTRVLLSDDDAQPGKQAKREIARLLEAEPFVALRSINELIDSLWMIVFGYAERQAEIDVSQLTDDLLRAGLRRVWRQGYRPRTYDYFRGRRSEIQEITRIIGVSPWTVIYGISGIGKTSVLSQLMSDTPFLERNLLWIDVTPLTSPLSILGAIAQTIETPGLSSINNYLEASNLPDLRTVVSALEGNLTIVVFDNFNAASDAVIALVEHLFAASKDTLVRARVVVCSTELPSWYSRVEQAAGHLVCFELLGLTIDDVENEFDLVLPHGELQAVHAATGGHPMAIRLLQQLLEQGFESEIDYATLRNKSISAVLDDLIDKIILKLPIQDQEFLAQLSIFNRSFATVEANVVIEGLAPRFALDNLVRKGILQFNGETFSIHDALRSVAQTMLRPNDAANLHLNMGRWYQTQVLEEFSARKEVTYELGFKWAHHIDAAHQLGQSMPDLSRLFGLTDEAIAALWDIERYGYPSDFSGADLGQSRATIEKLKRAKLIRKSRRADKSSMLYQVTSDDILASMLVAYRCITRNISGHMGYVPICKPNLACLNQIHVLCQWEHVIEFFPFGLMEQDDDVEEAIEAFSQHEFVDNLTEQLQILESLQGKKLTKRKLKRLDFGGCPLFGHICPGGVGQAQYCRSIETAEGEADNLDFTREKAASRHPLDYLLSQIAKSGES